MDDQSINQIVNEFVSDDGHLDKEALRVYVLDRFRELHRRVDYLLSNPTYKKHWLAIHDKLLSNGNDDDKQAVNEISNLHELIEEWIGHFVDTPERLEFSVQTKAMEISSGDQQADYFYALTARHDQLLCAVEVFDRAVENLSDILQLPTDEAIKSGKLDFFRKQPVKELIFKLAGKVYEIRTG